MLNKRFELIVMFSTSAELSTYQQLLQDSQYAAKLSERFIQGPGYMEKENNECNNLLK